MRPAGEICHSVARRGEESRFQEERFFALRVQNDLASESVEQHEANTVRLMSNPL